MFFAEAQIRVHLFGQPTSARPVVSAPAAAALIANREHRVLRLRRDAQQRGY
jgi:hypothetical protein